MSRGEVDLLTHRSKPSPGPSTEILPLIPGDLTPSVLLSLKPGAVGVNTPSEAPVYLGELLEEKVPSSPIPSKAREPRHPPLSLCCRPPFYVHDFPNYPKVLGAQKALP